MTNSRKTCLARRDSAEDLKRVGLEYYFCRSMIRGFFLSAIAEITPQFVFLRGRLICYRLICASEDNCPGV
jgi:hypothetical protein